MTRRKKWTMGGLLIVLMLSNPSFGWSPLTQDPVQPQGPPTRPPEDPPIIVEDGGSIDVRTDIALTGSDRDYEYAHAKDITGLTVFSMPNRHCRLEAINGAPVTINTTNPFRQIQVSYSGKTVRLRFVGLFAGDVTAKSGTIRHWSTWAEVKSVEVPSVGSCTSGPEHRIGIEFKE